MDYATFKARVNNFMYHAYITAERNRYLFGRDPLARRCAFFRVKYGLPYRYTEGKSRVRVRKLGDTGFYAFTYSWRNWRLVWRLDQGELACAEKYRENYRWRCAERLYRALGVKWWDVSLALRILFYPEYVGLVRRGSVARLLRILTIGARIQAPTSYLPVPLRRESVAALPPLLRDI